MLAGGSSQCGIRFDDNVMTKEYYLLKSCKELRNSSAHNNCLLDDLHTNNRNHYTHPYVSKELSKLKSVSKKVRYKKMSNFRTQQIVTLLYTHKKNCN